MNEKVEKVKKDIESFLMEDIEHQDKVIDCILINLDTEETMVIASDRIEDVILFAPYTTKENGYDKGYFNIPEWDFNFANYIFEELEKGYFVGYIDDEINYGIWNTLNDLFPEDIDHKEGVQKYLQYCADNGITKEYLDNKTKYDTPDIMKHFEGLGLNGKIEYKGYIIEADDINADNVNENLVHIYENQQDYINGEEIETVSLNTVGLKQNVREYIDEFYQDKTIVNEDKAYYTFVLGYDLLNDMIKKYETLECDTNYEFCGQVAEKFLSSKEYKDSNHSAYEMLGQWLENNKEQIETDYKDHIGFKDTFGLKRIIDRGYRRGEPIALVESFSEKWGKEYIIAFGYSTKNDDLSWNYGYYYDNDLKTATKDFQKVINGGNLARSFGSKEER